MKSMIAALAAAGFALAAASVGAQPIRVGELNSYKSQPAFLEPYKKGWELALEEINAAGGVLGRKMEVISRDDNGNPGDAVRVAEELISREKADLIFGTFLSHIGLAVTDFAKQRKVLFLAAEPLTDKVTWQNGNRYTYRLRPSTYMQAAMLVPEAAKLKKKRWAIVYPNYEYGQSAAATFKELLKKAQPDVEFVGEQAPALGRIDAGAVAQALADLKPDAIFNVLFGADLSKFVREGNTRGLFQGREVVSIDVRELTDVMDIMVVASGTSSRHVKSIASNVVDAARGWSALPRRPRRVASTRDRGCERHPRPPPALAPAPGGDGLPPPRQVRACARRRHCAGA